MGMKKMAKKSRPRKHGKNVYSAAVVLWRRMCYNEEKISPSGRRESVCFFAILMQIPFTAE